MAGNVHGMLTEMALFLLLFMGGGDLPCGFSRKPNSRILRELGSSFVI